MADANRCAPESIHDSNEQRRLEIARTKSTTWKSYVVHAMDRTVAITDLRIEARPILNKCNEQSKEQKAHIPQAGTDL